jgi:flagellin
MIRLSSGYSINIASDNSAGLSISEKMRSQIRGLDQASDKIEDGISLLQTAEGALSEVHSMLQRMTLLTVQAANDTNTEEERQAIEKEISDLKLEINRIGHDTEFNTMKLFDRQKISNDSNSLSPTTGGNYNLSGTLI